MKIAFFYLMVAVYLLSGINHFVYPGYYLQIMPHWIGWKVPLVYSSGIFEILLALLLLPKQTRHLAAWGIILLLIAVFPANIQMMVNYLDQNNPKLWITIIRLPVQLLLIWWAYLYVKPQSTQVTDKRNGT